MAAATAAASPRAPRALLLVVALLAASSTLAKAQSVSQIYDDVASALDYVMDFIQAAELIENSTAGLTPTQGITDALKNVVGFAGRAVVLAALEVDDVETLSGPAEVNKTFLQFMARDYNFANDAYKSWENASSPAAALAGFTGLPQSAILYYNPLDNQFHQPHFVALDAAYQRVLVVSRGSITGADWFTDFVGDVRVIAPGVGAHDGMTTSAQNLIADVASTVNAALAAHPGYTLTFIGHSLGAGVCALSTYLVKNGLLQGTLLAGAAAAVKGQCFATPPVLTMNAAVASMPYINTLILQDDVVPRASVANVDLLAQRVEGTTLSSVVGKLTLSDIETLAHEISGAFGRRSMMAAAAPTPTTAPTRSVAAVHSAVHEQWSKLRPLLLDVFSTTRTTHVQLKGLLAHHDKRWKSKYGGGKIFKPSGRRVQQQTPEQLSSSGRAVKQAVDLDLSVDSIPLNFPVGSHVLYELWSAGTLYQLLQAGASPSIPALTMVTAASPTDRWSTIYLKSDMVFDHLPVNVIPVLNAYIQSLP